MEKPIEWCKLDCEEGFSKWNIQPLLGTGIHKFMSDNAQPNTLHNRTMEYLKCPQKVWTYLLFLNIFGVRAIQDQRKYSIIVRSTKNQLNQIPRFYNENSILRTQKYDYYVKKIYNRLVSIRLWVRFVKWSSLLAESFNLFL